MAASELSLIAHVRFPQVSLSKLLFNPKLYSLIRYYMVETEYESQVDNDFLACFCQEVVSEIVQYIMEQLSPIMTEWLRKRPLIYSLVEGDKCFFGIDDEYVSSNMNVVLPCTLALTRNTAPHAHCGTLKQLNQLMAKEIAMIVNSKVAAEMNSNTFHLGDRSFDCEKISVESGGQMTALARKTLECMRRSDCKCTKQLVEENRSSCIHDEQGKKELNKHYITHGAILYCTSESTLMPILTDDIHIQNNNDANGQPECLQGSKEDKNESQDSHHLNSDISFLHPQQQYEVIVTVVTGLLMYSIKKAKASMCQASFRKTVHDVAGKAWQEINPSDIIVNTKKDKHVKRIYKAIFSDLAQMFDVASVLPKLQHNDNITIEALKRHLTTPNKRRSIPFFSAVTRAIMKPFQATAPIVLVK